MGQCAYIGVRGSFYTCPRTTFPVAWSDGQRRTRARYIARPLARAHESVGGHDIGCSVYSSQQLPEAVALVVVVHRCRSKNPGVSPSVQTDAKLLTLKLI